MARENEDEKDPKIITKKKRAILQELGAILLEAQIK
jgi:hypothetical protein